MLTIKPETRSRCLVLLPPAIEYCLEQPAADCDSWEVLQEFVNAWLDLQQQLPPDHAAETFQKQFGVQL